MPSATNIDAGFPTGTYPPAAGYFGYPVGTATREGQYPYGEYPPTPSDVWGYPPGTPAAAAGLQEPFNNFTANGWANLNGHSIVAGRNGTAAKVVDYGSSAFYTLPAPDQYVIVGFAYKRASYGEQSTAVSFYNGATRITRLVVSSGGVLVVSKDPAAIGVPGAQSASGAITFGAWNYVEVRLKVADTAAGAVKCSVNGASVFDVTGQQTTTAAGITTCTRVCIGSDSSASIDTQWDDLYILTGAAAAFQGDHVVP